MKRRGFIFSALVLLGGCKYGPVETQDGDGSSAHPHSDKLAHGSLDSINSNLLYARLQVASYLQWKFPSISTCDRCKLPWAIVRSHSTWYRQGQEGHDWGCFCLCEDCFRELGDFENVWPYYEHAWNKYWKDGIPIDKLRRVVEEEFFTVGG